MKRAILDRDRLQVRCIHEPALASSIIGHSQ
jgi:hypothetical protein